jgi:transposase
MSGLLKGSFVPAQHIRELRVLHRHRRKLIGQRTAEKNRLQNILEDANIKLGSVVSDVFGQTGQAIIEAIRSGNTDPNQLAELAKGSLVRKKDLLRRALNGKITDHHRFMLDCIVSTINHINHIIAHLEAQMGKYMQAMKEDAELLQTIPGVSAQTATGILAEIGNDMNVFPTHAHLSSWQGCVPATMRVPVRKNRGK